MRSIRQPGQPHPERIIAIPAQGRSLSIELQPGMSLLANMQRGFADAGFSGGVAHLTGVALAPFAYVMPALSKTGENAAFYSDIFRPAGISRIENGAITVGQKNGAPFFHCHAIWQEAGGKRSGGHILPDETIVAEPAMVQAFAITGACFESHPDPETNFTLFGPVKAEATLADIALKKAYAIRLRPNQDFCQAIEDFCKSEHIARARIYGGVGSTIGARLTDG
ncbi:MAG: PCC domain-containing protein, partial [Beijerinckiaceae bacterium]